MYSHCHIVTNNGMRMVAWHDGEPYSEQESVLVDMIDLITEERNIMLKEKMANG